MHQTQISWEGSPNRSIGGDIRYPPTTKIIEKLKNRKNTEVRKLNKKRKKNATEDKWPGGWGHEIRYPTDSEWLQIYVQPNGINLDNNIEDTKIKIALQKMKEKWGLDKPVCQKQT